MATPWQITKIHTIKGQMSDQDYRAMMMRDFGVESSKKLTVAQAESFIATLKTVTGNNGNRRRLSERMDGPFAGKLRALWIAGYHLSVFKNRDDTALIAFVQRQTGITHTRFLTDMVDAIRAIEALKKIITREAGVDWPDDKDHGAIKHEILRALVAKCAAADKRDSAALLADAVAQLHETARAPDHLDAYGLRDLDTLVAHLGKFLKSFSSARTRKRAAA